MDHSLYAYIVGRNIYIFLIKKYKMILGENGLEFCFVLIKAQARKKAATLLGYGVLYVGVPIQRASAW